MRLATGQCRMNRRPGGSADGEVLAAVGKISDGVAANRAVQVSRCPEDATRPNSEGPQYTGLLFDPFMRWRDTAFRFGSCWVKVIHDTKYL
jgi:hypothetical protein